MLCLCLPGCASRVLSTMRHSCGVAALVACCQLRRRRQQQQQQEEEEEEAQAEAQPAEQQPSGGVTGLATARRFDRFRTTKYQNIDKYR